LCEYAKQVGFATKIRNSQRNKDIGAIKNQLLTCNKERKMTSDIPEAEKTNKISSANCPARIFVHIQKKTQLFVISKVVLEHSHLYSANLVEMLPQLRDLSMYVRQIIENNDQACIRPSKTYSSLITAAGGHHALSYIEKDVRNYITREVCNISEEDAKEAMFSSMKKNFLFNVISY
ncbi:hypothetical protein PIB30_047878, partial [Stylosanthes scabra]|nr:hypothetical protein [Stylosanthes scabra]